MFCNKCGNKLEDNSIFCDMCGSKTRVKDSDKENDGKTEGQDVDNTAIDGIIGRKLSFIFPLK